MAGAVSEDKVNMIPLIDCMFFLILFFMIVTKFTPDEKAIASLLPTDKGQLAAASTSPVPTDTINIAIFPEGLQKNQQPSALRAIVDKMWADGTFNKRADLRIGGEAVMRIEGEALASKRGAEPQLNAFHEYVKRQLEAREQGGKARKEQYPVVISCYSGLGWKYAITAYDAVRAYEATKTGKFNKSTFDLQEAREVSFAPPRIRNYSTRELNDELYEIVNLK
jgi:biopolymer transport protein ExbD